MTGLWVVGLWVAGLWAGGLWAGPASAQAGPRPLVPPGEAATAPGLVESDITIEMLDTVPAEAVGLPGAGSGFGADLWRDSDRGLVEALLPRLPDRGTGRAARDLVRRLLLTAAPPPPGPGAGNMVALRAERLLALGDTADAARLMAGAPAGLRDSALRDLAVQADFLAGKTDAACAAVAGEEGGILTPSWQQAAIYCQLRAGKRAEAELGLALLREAAAEAPDPLFVHLAQARLSGTPGDLPEEAQLSPVSLALLRDAKLEVPPRWLAGATPGLLAAVAGDDGLATGIRLRAALLAERFGSLETAAVAALLQQHIAENPDSGLAAPGAILAADRETIPVARAEALQEGLKAARAAGLYPVFARLAIPALARLAPGPELAWFAPDAIPALLRVGDLATALEWFTVLRTESRFKPELARAVDRLWPIMHLAAGAAGGVPHDSLAVRRWLDGASRDAPATDLILAALTGLGEKIDGAVWADRLQGEAIAGGPRSPGLWLAMAQAAANGRPGETVLLGLVIAGMDGLDNPVVLHGVVAALRAVDLEPRARRLAVETVLAATGG